MTPVDPSPPILRHDWLGACRRAREAVAGVLADAPTSQERVRETGTTGEGGDRTLLIDQAAEDAVFAELEALHRAGARFTAVSEERGFVDFGDPDCRVVIDPIDGSQNAKRGLGHHALSIAVSAGPTMADVVLGYVFDFGPSEEWHAIAGEGAYLAGVRLTDPPPERRKEDGRLELVAVESADPRWIGATLEGLQTHVARLRVMGAIAVSMSQVALTRVDGMATLWRTRAVDCAASQLIVRESGGVVCFPAMDEPLGAPLDLEPHSPVVAARSPEALAQLVEAVSHG